jgi:hypothetical protein
MTKAVAVTVPLHRRDEDKGDDGEVASAESLAVELEKATAPIRARQEKAAAARAKILARERLVPGAVVIIEVAHPDEGVGAGQLGRITSLRGGDAALVSTKGATRTVEVLCPLDRLHWIWSD